MKPQTRYTTARDGRVIAWTMIGDGPLDLLYVPASISATEQLWEHPTVMSFFERLSSFCRLILYDRRGSGMSERLQDAASLEEQVDDVHAVLDAAGSERAAILATYEGGAMAMLFAASAPERSGALILYATMARMSAAPGYEFAWPDADRQATMNAINAEWGVGTGMFARFAPGYANDRGMTEWFARLQRLAMDPTYAAKVMVMNGSVDVRGVLASIQAPTLVLHRRHDAGFDNRHSAYLAEHIPNARLAILDGEDSLPFLGDSDSVLGEIQEFLTGARAEREPDRILSTVLFTDICRSTERAAELGDARWRALLEQHDSAVRTQLARHRGRAVKSVGDGVLATFDGPARAIRAAHGIAEDVGRIGLDVRAGLHTGECEVMGDDVGGLAVHIAARVVASAQAREVLVSNTVKDLVVGSGLRFDDRGEHELRGVPGTWRLWSAAA
ncbi:MAG: adenylate/guanylate cyclase domain-containing protein [Solirubrobacteraceae bacterium]